MTRKVWKALLFATCLLFYAAPSVNSEEDEIISEEVVRVDENIGKSSDASRTDDEVVQREEESILIDGLSPKEMKQLREQSEKHIFQAEVNRMMKLIINSLYKNKEIFLREVISNASDALDKIRIMSLTDDSALAATSELSIKVKVDKENNVLHITDTGIGMTKDDLLNNLGTIAKSGTNDFFEQMTNASSEESVSDLIGKFGVGFYSTFLVAEKVVVTSKHNSDSQHIWESDSESFFVVVDPRGDSLGRGTTVSLYLKEEASDFLEHSTITQLIQKYSQFINFPIYLWSEKRVKEEIPFEEEEAPESPDEVAKDEDEDFIDEAQVEEESENEKPKTRIVEKTVWDWELMNETKPIWQRPSKEIEDEEYNEFYKAMAKMYVRRVFITDDFDEMMPKYLKFVKGVVDSDDLPLNVSRETLQQHKLLKVIRKKLVRKALEMIKKIDPETYTEKFWPEFGTNVKLGVIEDHANRTRLAKLLRFFSSKHPGNLTSLEDYIGRTKENQDKIYYCAGNGREEVEKSPFVERLLKKGYEVLYLTETVDQYTIQTLPEFDGKQIQNVAKEGLGLDEGKKAKERKEKWEKKFEPLADWLKEKALKDKIEKAVITEHLIDSPCALVAGKYGWSGNMERIMRAQPHKVQQDMSADFYAKQKKTLEINPRHPLIQSLLERIELDANDEIADEIAQAMFDTAVLRSGYMIQDSLSFSKRVLKMIYSNLGIDPHTPIEEELEIEEEYEEEIAMEEEEVTDDVKQVYVDNEDSAQLDSIEAAEENEDVHNEL